MARNFKDLPPVVQAVILIAGTLVLAGGFFWFRVWPLYKKIEQLDREVRRLKAENERNQVFEQQRTEYLVRIESLKKQIETQRSFVPDEPAQDQFVRTVHDAAASSGIYMRTFVAQAQVPRDFYVEMPFSSRLDGTYFALLNFFERLSRTQRIVSVTSISLGGPGGGGMGAYTIRAGETVGANVVLTTYFTRPQPATPPPPPPRR